MPPHKGPTPERRRRAIVTGAARGIGAAIAAALRARRYDVVLVDADEAVESVAEAMGATSLVVDLVSPGATEAIATAVGDRPLWLLVNNAGRFDRTPLLEIDLARWDHIQAVNTRSMVATMQAVVPGMIERGAGGRIVNMSSMAAKLGTPGEAAYAASKAAVVALSRIAAMELGPHAITVNSICPGYVLTDLGAGTRSADDVATWQAMSPLGRVAEVGDVAALVCHLASDDAGYVTGEALNVTGGMCTW